MLQVNTRFLDWRSYWHRSAWTYGRPVREMSFESDGSRCAGWHVPAVGSEFAHADGRGCVVMARGVPGFRDPDVIAYAAAFSAAGLEVLLFDYRGSLTGRWGAARRHRRDFQAAVAAARRLPGVNPERIVLWGSTPTAEHVLPVAAADGRVAAALVLHRMSSTATSGRRDRQTPAVSCPVLLQFVAADDLPVVEEHLEFLRRRLPLRAQPTVAQMRRTLSVSGTFTPNE